MKICDCDSPNEIQALGARGYCQTCKNEIFQGPRNEVEKYLYKKLLSAQNKIEAQAQAIEKLREQRERLNLALYKCRTQRNDVIESVCGSEQNAMREMQYEYDQEISAILNTQEGL